MKHSMSAKTRLKYTLFYRWFFALLTVAGQAVVVTVAIGYTTTMQVEKVAPALLPILAAFFAFSALMYNRARAYPDGPMQRRALYAADEALTATILYLLGLLIGAAVTFLVMQSKIQVKTSPVIGDPVQLDLLWFYLIPLMLIGFSFITFSQALRVFCKTITIQSYVWRRLNLMKKRSK